MYLPFTAEQFSGVFRAYHHALWPAPVALTGLAVAACALVPVNRRWADAAVASILGLLWLWLGLAYHLAFFATINPLAYGFAALSMIGAGIFAWHGPVRQRLRFGWPGTARGVAGACLVTFSLLVYPVWSWYAGQRYPAMPTFGLPCPTTLFTIGLLMFMTRPYPRTTLVVPLLWCLVGAQAAYLLSVPQDLSLVVAALAAIALLVRAGPPGRQWPLRRA